MRLWLLLALAACDSAPAAAPPAIVTEPRTDTSDLVARFECNRCHELAGVAAAPPTKSCVQCHQEIHANTFAIEPREGRHPPDDATLASWRAHITSLRWVPTLAAADRLRRTWIRDYLLAPYDVRPNLIAEMPRLALTVADAERLARALAPASDERPIDGDIARGESLYTELCTRCHRFTGTRWDHAQLPAADASAALAPDLQHARDRMTEHSLASWIEHPRGAMPDLKIAAADARALAVFIARTPRTRSQARVPARLSPLTRTVAWDEVETKVFRHLCWHCHSEPDFARGDGGPGNTGGFGFAPRGLDLSSYAAISAGSFDDNGERRSVFAPLADGTPRLVAHLYARYVEESGSSVPGIRGMPLGLPPLPLEEIQLVESWVLQGRPR